VIFVVIWMLLAVANVVEEGAEKFWRIVKASTVAALRCSLKYKSATWPFSGRSLDSRMPIDHRGALRFLNTSPPAYWSAVRAVGGEVKQPP
jgi:hypothetical protein